MLRVSWHYEKGLEKCFVLLLFALENAFFPASLCELVLLVVAFGGLELNFWCTSLPFLDCFCVFSCAFQCKWHFSLGQSPFVFMPKSIRFQAKVHSSLAGMSFAFKPKSDLLQFKGWFTLSRIPFFFDSNVIPLLIKSKFTSDAQAFCSFVSSCTSFLLST